MEIIRKQTPLKQTVTTVTVTNIPLLIRLKCYKSMIYGIDKATAPAMPNLGKCAECIKILFS